jgi:2-hydroxy-3-oxopropionate reductase
MAEIGMSRNADGVDGADRDFYTAAAEIGLEAPITTQFESLYADAVAHGLADLDHSGLFVELARRNGIE